MKRTAAWIAILGFLSGAALPAQDPTVMKVGPAAGQTRVPPVLRQGTFLAPQAVSAIEVTEDGKRISVATLAFKHDKNFWLLSADGEPQWGRQVAPWAPFQVASSRGGGAFGVGMAYSRVTGPNPTIGLFGSEKGEETEIVDSLGELGWIRYGSGDWRTGWIPSLIGDLVVRSGESVITVRGHNGGVRAGPDGRVEKHPFPYTRAFRLTASSDGTSLGLGFILPEPGTKLPEMKISSNWSKHLLSILDSATMKERWSFDPPADLARPAPLPDPVLDFPEFAREFGLKTEPPVPARVAASVASNADGSLVALADYGAWVSYRKGPVSGKWDPPYHVIPFVPRQRGMLRIVAAPGRETVHAPFPKDGLFEVRVDPAGKTVWAIPASWFARGMAGAAWLPADEDARSLYAFDVSRGTWDRTWELPDAVADVALHPKGERAWVSCWDGALYSIPRDGSAATRAEAGGPARLAWSPDGSFAAAGTDAGEVLRLDDAGRIVWKTKLATTELRSFEGQVRPPVEGVPIYPVGRVGMEHAYVGDTWLIKMSTGALLVDAGGTSAIPWTLQKIRAAGVDPASIKHLLHSHSHGDHAGGTYLWRARGIRIVAPETAALATAWLMPTVTDYGVWVPRPVDVPLPLKKTGDETEITLDGLKIRAVFVPGHSYDLVVYLFELDGKRIAFTGDLGFVGQDILHRCWGDADKAERVAAVIKTKILEYRPDVVFTGHGAQKDGTAFLTDLVQKTEESVRKARGN